MEAFRVILFGNEHSGKTQLFKRIMDDKVYIFEQVSKPTQGVDYGIRYLDLNTKLLLWDLAGDKRFSAFVDAYSVIASVALLCVDLTQVINEAEIKAYIETFRKHNRNAHVILVGTKADSLSANASLLKTIKIDDQRTTILVVSAKTNIGISELFHYICSLGHENRPPETEDTQRASLFEEAIRKLITSLSKLPYEKRRAINEEIKKLLAQLAKKAIQDNVHAKARAITEFSNNCQAILDNSYPLVFKAILTVVAAAVVTLVIGCIGFGIGLALGSWTGPGAFISALMIGNTMAVAVTTSSITLGVGGGSLSAYGLFQSPQEKVHLDNFVADISLQI
ncbi:GTP-binding protein [Legionella drancourtii]|uniref:GTP-binding protein n=1 Tax=Legionella drancourtii LLAP12 TaxID=658187 RepID=G9EUN4_9GAMM|nr:GTP-binding protein [Legionella drancourtii]EHL29034.1 hypothetical protein LDG_9032 [Legionella drancourtii LLAP12]